jgi:hypothetical protein
MYKTIQNFIAKYKSNSPRSHQKRVLAYLQTNVGKPVSSNYFVYHFGIRSIPSIVLRLRKQGHVIHSMKDGSDKRTVFYILEEKYQDWDAIMSLIDKEGWSFYK